MNWPRKKLIFRDRALSALLSFISIGLCACGVKGDPVPPEKPPELGRGRPTYKRATEDIKVEKSGTREAPLAPKMLEEDEDDKE